MRYGFVVEGLHDKDLLLGTFNNIEVVHCRGTVFTNKEKHEIKRLIEKCNHVFLMFDPDAEGDKFTRVVQEIFPLHSLRLDPKQCTCYRFHKLKIGVEHASKEYLIAFLTQHGLFLDIK